MSRSLKPLPALTAPVDCGSDISPSCRVKVRSSASITNGRKKSVQERTKEKFATLPIVPKGRRNIGWRQRLRTK
jgi:hypothetical protein